MRIIFDDIVFGEGEVSGGRDDGECKSCTEKKTIGMGEKISRFDKIISAETDEGEGNLKRKSEENSGKKEDIFGSLIDESKSSNSNDQGVYETKEKTSGGYEEE